MLVARISALFALLTLPAGMWIAARDDASDEALSVIRGARRAISQAAGQWREEQVFERRLDASPGGALRVDLPDADIEITSGDAGAVTVAVFVRARDMDWGREVFERMEFSAQTDGNGIAVRAVDPRIQGSEWRRHRGVGVTARISIPARYNVDVHTSDGDVRILNDIEGIVVLRSSDGDIGIQSVRGTRVSLETSDGDIHARDIQSTQVTLRTSDGDIVVRRVSGQLDARTSDGDVSIEMADIRGATVTTHDGDITLYAAAGLQADVTLEGERLSVDRGLALTGRMSSRRIQGTLNGGGARIVARTSDGDIDFRIR